MEVGGMITVNGGFFTFLKYIRDLDRSEMERAVGFEAGRLLSGFWIAELAPDEVLAPDEFELAASTRWSAGTMKLGPDRPETGIESVLVQRGEDVQRLRTKVAAFMARRGGNTPAKVLPTLRHTEGMRYPDAEVLGPGIRSGIPQFKLLAQKRFAIVRIERPAVLLNPGRSHGR